MDGVYSDEEHFLIQNSFSEEILQHNFSINYILDGLVASDQPAPRNSCAEDGIKASSDWGKHQGWTDRIAQKQ